MIKTYEPFLPRTRRGSVLAIGIAASLVVLGGCGDKTKSANTTALAPSSVDPTTEAVMAIDSAAPDSIVVEASKAKRKPPLMFVEPGEGRAPIELLLDAPAAAPSSGGRMSVSLSAPILARGKGYIGADGRRWHDINKGKGGSGEQPAGAGHKYYPNGDHEVRDADGTRNIWRADGSFDSIDPGGTWTHVNPDGTGSVSKPDGRRTDFNEESNGDTTRTDFDKDGNETGRKTTNAGGDDAPTPNSGDSIELDAPSDPMDNSGEAVDLDEPSDPIANGPDAGDDEGDEAPPPFGENPPNSPAGGTGEPHFQTENGVGITSQRIGDFVLSSGIEGRSLQARISPWNGSRTVSAISALAVGFGPDRLIIDVDGTATVNGEPAPNGTEMAYGGDGGIVGIYRDDAGGPATTVTAIFTDLSTLSITRHGSDGARWLNFVWQGSAPTNQSSGILGSDDTDPANDVTGRDGTVADTTSDAAVDTFVRSWRVTAGESMFVTPFPKTDGIADDSPQALDAFPFAGDTAAGAMDQAAIDAACAKVSSSLAKRACTYDLAATGEMAFAESATAFDARIIGATSRAGAAKMFATFSALLRPKKAATVASTTPKSPGAMTLSSAEKSGAAELPLDTAGLKVTIGAGEVGVYKFTGTTGKKFGTINNNLECGNTPFTDSGGAGGSGLFDNGGASLSLAVAACSELGIVDVATDVVYLKLVGPAAFDLRLNII